MDALAAGPNHLLRRPDWRWETVRDLVENPSQRFRPCADAPVRIAKQFWSAWVRCRNPGDHENVIIHMPTMSRAFVIFQDSQSPLRHALEARVLAAVPPEAIAAKNALPPEVIHCYEDVFWDVRRYLGSPDYIFTQVLGPRMHATGQAWNYDLAWKFFAYIGGACVLDELMHAFGPGTRPKDFAEVEAFLTGAARSAVQRQIATAAQAIMPGDPRTATELQKLHAQLRRSKETDDVGTAQTSFERHVEAMLQELPWTVGEKGRKMAGPLAAYDECAAELRDDELLLAAAGEKAPALSAFKDIKLPQRSRSESGEKTGPQKAADDLLSGI